MAPLTWVRGSQEPPSPRDKDEDDDLQDILPNTASRPNVFEEATAKVRQLADLTAKVPAPSAGQLAASSSVAYDVGDAELIEVVPDSPDDVPVTPGKKPRSLFELPTVRGAKTLDPETLAKLRGEDVPDSEDTPESEKACEVEATAGDGEKSSERGAREDEPAAEHEPPSVLSHPEADAFAPDSEPFFESSGDIDTDAWQAEGPGPERDDSQERPHRETVLAASPEVQSAADEHAASGPEAAESHPLRQVMETPIGDESFADDDHDMQPEASAAVAGSTMHRPQYAVASGEFAPVADVPQEYRPDPQWPRKLGEIEAPAPPAETETSTKAGSFAREQTARPSIWVAHLAALLLSVSAAAIAVLDTPTLFTLVATALAIVVHQLGMVRARRLGVGLAAGALLLAWLLTLETFATAEITALLAQNWSPGSVAWGAATVTLAIWFLWRAAEIVSVSR